MSGGDLAAAATALAGCRFRLHGRDPATGLDCVGVLAAALAAIGRRPPLPNGYPLRMRRIDALDRLAAGCGLRAVEGPAAAGDVLLVRSAPCQPHLAIVVDGGFIHAHAALRRVVMAPGPIPWPIVGHWRLEEDSWQP